MQASEQIMSKAKSSYSDQQFISLVEKEVNGDDELLMDEKEEESAALEQDVFGGIEPPKMLGSELFQSLLPLS